MIIRIKVKPNQLKTRIVEKGEVWKINVKAKPLENKANEEIIKFFSRMFKKDVRIIRGKKGREKVLEVL